MTGESEMPPPHWGYHVLGEKYRSRVAGIGRFFGFDDIESGEVGWRVSLRFCLDGERPEVDEKWLRNSFLKFCKYEFVKWKQSQQREISMSKFRSDDEQTDDSIYNSIATNTRAVQEDFVFVCQCVAALDQLPKAHRRTMRKIAMGYSVMDIAVAESRDIHEVMEQVRTSRDWVKDFVKYGDA